MINYLMKAFGILAIAMLSLLTACQEEGLNIAQVENYTEQAVFEIEQEARSGRGGCYEFVFPISIDFPDQSTVEVESYEELRNAVRSWKEANMGTEDRPSLGFPLEVSSEDGEIMSVTDRDELRVLKRSCRRDFRNRGRNGRYCFNLVFPLSIEYPDGTIDEVTDRRSLKESVRGWKRNNPHTTERPSLVFPIEVKLEDGSVESVEDADALRALKDDCGS